MSAPEVPPYRRIAADLRRRILAGELSPGDRLPSTRRIATEWNVALATATKALTALRQEGLIQAQARVGTVVAPRRGPARAQGTRATAAPRREPAGPAPEGGAAAHRELTRERIVRAAIEIADTEGLPALSMRGVAARLGAAAMSPYRHVNGRDDLVLLMADAVLGELSWPQEPPAHWRARLEYGARALWAVHRAHPWLAQIGPLTRPLMLPNLMAYSEWMLSALDGHGLDAATMLDVNVLLYSHVQGIAVQWERENQAQGATGVSDEEWMDSQAPALAAIVGSGAYPTLGRVLAAVGESGYDLRLDELFERGLQSMLDGLAALVERTAPTR
ncbi:TetR/AcrR family transcriptional regulator C-terminal domain-containing protein [Streptomyces sp. NPDC018031]|uniref:TetR/AcrR family transcriptional regulator C-terminal domain-containing protein n=1 Tax=Streptomyces sp. NPDC018031 TaxID=3365033 RepID=UPI0037AE16F3